MAYNPKRRSLLDDYRDEWRSIASIFRGNKRQSALYKHNDALPTSDEGGVDVTQEPQPSNRGVAQPRDRVIRTQVDRPHQLPRSQWDDAQTQMAAGEVPTQRSDLASTAPVDGAQGPSPSESNHQEPGLTDVHSAETHNRHTTATHANAMRDKQEPLPVNGSTEHAPAIGNDFVLAPENIPVGPSETAITQESEVSDEKMTKEQTGSGSSTSSRDLEADYAAARREEKEEEEKDPFSVGWEGKDDPAYPYNWTGKKKGGIIAVMSSVTLITPLASSMFAPGVPQVTADFHEPSITLASFVVSVFLIGYVAGPLFVAPISEMYGRTWVYNVSNVFFVIFTIACAVSSSFNMLIGFRFLCGVCGATPLVLGGGTIADMYPQEKRGGVMAIWAMGPLLGPVIGPIAGGFIAETIGWRWVFWVLAIAAGIFTIGGVLILRETYSPVLLERKAKRIRKETGDDRYRSCMASKDTPRDVFKRSIVRPMKMLFLSPIVMLMSIYMSVVYGYLYLLFTTITEVFEGTYGFGAGVVGLAYLGIGIGMFVGLGAFGVVSDRTIKKKMAQGITVKPELRLPPMIPGTLCIPIGLFWYGWSAEAKVHWIMPIIGTAWVGLGLIGTFMPIQTYLVDSFTIYAASAIAANTIMRSLVGAILPLAGRPLYQNLGLGWGNSVLAFIGLAMVPVPVIFLKYGEYLRTSERFKVKF